VNVDTDKLEERAAVILGQIQASVAEYVRTMNEAGALRRREVDEVQRQQDEAIKVLKAVQTSASATADAHSRLAAKLGEDWLGMVERGLHGAAQLQARTAAATAIAQIDLRLTELAAAVRDSLIQVGKISERNQQIARSLAWKTIGVTAAWLTAAAIGVRILLV
jgi:hypothetical protein